jgi:hypothetical protein
VTSVHDRVLDFLAQRYRESVDLVSVTKLSAPAYGFDPAGWDLFIVSSKIPPPVLRGSEYVAVHRSTGEMRYLGILGD